ncbi:dihydroneopterin aldolase [Proteiniphilum sp. UBA1028]|jgi:dihydroneopterin aldolase|uniref:dihydroneopterin aldolase n=1 Tax=Proteiniphilum sp. UBA1028 TaxID=1947251 RepID=UPI000E877069|nr:dihydroneopterin aldolase [Proteiniphilum sp. UBA1028]HBG58881.1 dihydroneopterin aldolase [Porphyromonadaceae bacterium]
MKTTIELSNMRFYAYHGVLPQETVIGSEYIVNLTLEANIATACITDNVNNTINYADVFDLVKTEMKISSQLLEHVAGRIFSKLEENYPQLSAITVSVAKMHPPVDGEMEKAAIVLTSTV